MKQITKNTLKKIEETFKQGQGYIFSEDNQIYCTQVNGLINICLASLGFLDTTRNNWQMLFNSNLYNNKLFYREINLEGKIINQNINSGKNAIAALSLYLSGLIDESSAIIDNLYDSPIYNKTASLFTREYNPETGEINPLTVTQSNLWIALVLAKLNKIQEANSILESLNSRQYYKFLKGQDCRFQDAEERIFSDDQALLSLVYINLGKSAEASNILEEIFESPLYDKETGLFNKSFSSKSLDNDKSVYKNGLVGIALSTCNFKEELKRLNQSLINYLYENGLFRQSLRDEIKIPDNSALALMSIEEIKI